MISRLVSWILCKLFPVLEEHKELIKIFSNIFFTFFLLVAVTTFVPTVQYGCEPVNFTGINWTMNSTYIVTNFTGT